MASFPTSRAGLIIFVVILGGMSGVGVFASISAGRVGMLAPSLGLAAILGLLIYVYPRRVIVTEEEVGVEYYIRSRKSWPLSSVKVVALGFGEGVHQRVGQVLSLCNKESQKEVFTISRGLLEKQFDPLVNELRSSGVEIALRAPRKSISTPRIEVEVDGKREVRYRGGRSVLCASFAVCAIVAIGSFMALSLPWDVPIAEREKLIVCFCVGLLALPAIWLVPRGVMGVVFREDKVTIKRIWRSNLILRREDITSLTSRKSRIDETGSSHWSRNAARK